MFINQDSTSYISTFSEEITNLPQVHVRSEVTEVAAEANAVGEAIELRTHTIGVNPTNTTLEAVVEDVIKQYQALKANPEFESVFNSFDRLAAKIGEQIGSVFNILTTVITPEVESLRSTIEARMETLLRQDNKEIIIDSAKTEPTPITFKVCDWDNTLACMGGSNVVRDNFQDIARTSLTGDARDLRIDLNRDDLRIQPLNIADDVADGLFAHIAEQVGDQAPDYRELFDIALGRNASVGADFIPANTIRAFMNGSDVYQVVVQASDIITRYADRVESLKKFSLNTNDETLTRYLTNLEIINRQLVMAAYTLMICREHYRDALVLSYDVLNSDLIEAMHTEALSENDVSVYIQSVYDQQNATSFPVAGISIATIKANLENARNLVAEQRKDLLKNAELIRNQYRFRAVREVLAEHIQQTEQSRIPSGMTMNDFVTANLRLLESFITHLDSTDDNNLQNFLYHFVIETYYPGSIVASVHQLFGTTLTDTLKVKPEITQTDIASVNLTVAAKLAADFLFKEIICAHKAAE